MTGFTGKILHINLTDKSIHIEKPEESFYRKYMGGGGFGAYYLMKETKAHIDPLGPENVIVYSIGPGTGAAISGASRHCVTTKSPLTGTIGTGESGGYWSAELRFAGYDAVVVKGKAESPVYIYINNDDISIRDASAMWGKPTKQAQQGIRDEVDNQKARCLLIGPGGENLVKYSNIVNELGHFNGRNGMGAVMGSKNLKGVVVAGSQKPTFPDKEKISELAKRVVDDVKSGSFATTVKELGTPLLVNVCDAMGNLPTRNWTSGTFEDADEISGERMRDTILKKTGTCWACAQSCKRVVECSTGKYTLDPAYGGPEYETIGMCGSNLGISDLVTVCKINELCNMHTMDTISFGGTVGFVMDCFEKGIITIEDTGGIEIRFGDGDTVIKLVEMTARREGVGDLLAEGTAVIAKKFGEEAEANALYIKGKEFPAHMPQAKAVLALTYACCPFGPDHNSVEHDPSLASDPLSESMQSFGFEKQVDTGDLNFEKAKLYAYTTIGYSVLDTVSVCQLIFNYWSTLNFDNLVEFINACTGWKTSLFEIFLAGERRLNLFKLFNQREGFTKDDDMLPKKLFKPLKNEGATAGRYVDEEQFYKMRDVFYTFMGWDIQTGNPTDLKIEELNLEWTKDYM